MPDTILAEIMKDQFHSAFGILAGSIPTFTPEEWRTGRSPFDGPARCVAHVLQCAEYYTCSDRAVFASFGKPIWEMAEDDLPSQQDMAEYLERTRAMTDAWIDEVATIGFDQPSGTDNALGLARVTYALRHLQHHTGEACAYQKQFNHPQEQW
jgi:hypothetical protein